MRGINWRRRRRDMKARGCVARLRSLLSQHDRRRCKFAFDADMGVTIPSLTSRPPFFSSLIPLSQLLRYIPLDTLPNSELSA